MNKKVLIIGFFFIIAYFAQLFYIGSINKDIFDQFTKENDIYKVENVNFQKGIFRSNASFDLVFKDSSLSSALKEKTPVKIVFHNNFFYKNNLEIDFGNPFKELDPILKDKLLAKIYVDITLAKEMKLSVHFSDFNSSNLYHVNFISKNMIADIDLNKNMLMQSISLNIDEISFKSKYDIKPIIYKGISYKEEYKNGINLLNITKDVRESISNISIENINIYEFVDISKIYLGNILSFNDDNKTFKDELKLDIAKIRISSKFMPEQNISNVNLNLVFNNISKSDLNELVNGRYVNQDNFLENFASYRPNFTLSNFSLVKDGKNIVAKADGLMEDFGYKINSNIISDSKISEIFPASVILNLDDYFVEKDGKYEMDFVFDSTDENSTKMSINGKDVISNNNTTFLID